MDLDAAEPATVRGTPTLSEVLASGGGVVLDGALATYLEELGAGTRIQFFHGFAASETRGRDVVHRVGFHRT